MIVNRSIKVIKYISILSIIDIAKLTKVFHFEIVYRYNISDDIVNNRDFIFISVF